METNNILTANWLDILFDNRNKQYGAYELRKTYEKRIGKALLCTTIFIALVFAGASFAGSGKNDLPPAKENGGIVISDYEPKEIPEKLPEPEIQKVKEQPKTIMFTDPVIVDKEVLLNPPPSIDDMENAKIDLVTNNDGPDYKGIAGPPLQGDNKGIVAEKPKKEEDDIKTIVQVEAKYNGDWVKFLERNLNPEVPAQNGAAPGMYRIVIQFVVDKDGNISNIKPITDLGFGMEEEAVRVIKKATKWEPAIQNGFKVKAYRKQPITFQVLDE